MRVLITGCCGFIGAHVVAEALSLGWDVWGMDDESRTSNAKWVKDTLGPQYHKMDLRSLPTNRGFLSCFDAVIHLAARTMTEESHEQVEGYTDTNVRDTAALVKVMSELGTPLVFASTSDVYKPDVSVHALSDLQPSSWYGVTKLAIEHLIRIMMEKRAIILRPMNVIGATVGLGTRIGDNKYMEVGPIFARSVAMREPVTINSLSYPTKDGSPCRDFVDVRDTATAFCMAAEQVSNGNWGTWNIGTGKARSVLELAQELARVANEDWPNAPDMSIKLEAARALDYPVMTAQFGSCLPHWVPEYRFPQTVRELYRYEAGKRGTQ